MPTEAREKQARPAKGVVRAEQVARLMAAITYRGIKIGALAKKMKPMSRNTIHAHLDGKSTRPITTYYLRRYEEALGLPRLALDSGSPQEITALLRKGPLGVSEPHPAPFTGPSEGLEGAIGFIRSQLAGYQATGRPVPPAVVVAWLSELESAAATAGASVPTRGSGAGGSGTRAAG